MNFSQFIVIVDIQVLRLIRTTGQNYDQNLTSTVLGLSSQFPPAPNFEGGVAYRGACDEEKRGLGAGKCCR